MVAAHRSIKLAAALTAGFATLLIGAELVSVSAAFLWALSGLLELNPIVTLVLDTLTFAVCAVLTFIFARRALLAERAEAAATGAVLAP